MTASSIGKRLPVWILVMAILVPAAVPAKSGGDKRGAMAAKLASLRTEVNDLDARIRSERTRAAATLNGLEGRKAELEVILDAAMVRAQALEDEVVELQEEANARKEAAGGLASVVIQAVSDMEEHVRSGLPFQVEERLEALRRIRRELEKGGDTTSSAIALWRFAQDERRLASTVEPARITVNLPGEKRPILSRIVRVGMIAMFVRTEAELWRIYAGPSGPGYTKIKGGEAKTEIRRLFEAIDRRITGGRYRLPLLGVGEETP